MKFDYKTFHVDILVRHDGDKHIGRAHIYRGPAEGSNAGGFTYETGDLQGFESEADAVTFAQQKAILWIKEQGA